MKNNNNDYEDGFTDEQFHQLVSISGNNQEDTMPSTKALSLMALQKQSAGQVKDLNLSGNIPGPLLGDSVRGNQILTKVF